METNLSGLIVGYGNGSDGRALSLRIKLAERRTQFAQNAARHIQRALQHTRNAYGVLIGDLAVKRYGIGYYTSRAEAVLDATHYSKVLRFLLKNRYGLLRDGILIHSKTDTEIELLKEGEFLKNGSVPLPHPRELGANLEYCDLPALIALRLDRYLLTDQVDVIKLITPRLKQSAEIEQKIPPVLRPRFHELLECARKESR